MSIETRSCLACGIRVSWIGLFVSLGLAGMKCAIGILADSRALVACALYSLNDALSAAVALVSLRLARRPPDLDHAYGYGKAEFVAIGGVAFILAAAVIFFLGYALPPILRGSETPPHLVALLGALVTAGISFFLYRWESCAAHHLGSPVMHTSAEHNHADAISSVLTVGGVAGAMVGLRFLDPLVAILETLDVMRLSGKLLGSTLRGLMDTALPPEELEVIRQAATRVPGVLRVLTLRSRHAGPQTWIDLDLELSPAFTVEEAQQVAAKVRREVQLALARPAELQIRFSGRCVIGAPEPVTRGAASHA